MNIPTLGVAKFESPIAHPTSDAARIPLRIMRTPSDECLDDIYFEMAGPRSKLYFDPAQTRAGIVTCGGLCPGMNNVIRSLFLELHHIYRVAQVLGFRYGYQGLEPGKGLEPLVLTPQLVDDIHKEGGTMLGTSRGPFDTKTAVDTLIRRKINILFAVGGDGTLRGAKDLYQEACRQGYPLAVVGIPKTIDNDVAFVSRTFGYLTAVEEAARVIDCAHNEAHSVRNGISLVKLMGRYAGFIAAGATVASQDVNFILVPEIPFKLEGERGFLAVLKKRILARAHAVIVVAEGAGQDLLPDGPERRDASGNIKLKDIGLFLRDQIDAYFKAENIHATLRYFDPSYIIRSRPADAEDAILCDLFARNAVHAAMAGKTGLVIGLIHDKFIHVPVEMIVSERKRISADSVWWQSVLAATGQPERFE